MCISIFKIKALHIFQISFHNWFTSVTNLPFLTALEIHTAVSPASCRKHLNDRAPHLNDRAPHLSVFGVKKHESNLMDWKEKLFTGSIMAC